MERCLQCDAHLEKPVASICASIMGDEYSDTYYFCPACDRYTVSGWRDRFLGEETPSGGGLLDRAEGDERVAIIARCSRPWDKNCRCDAHREYFGDSLD